jgi:death-on-curing protein
MAAVDPTRYLTLDEVLQLHIEIMERTGSEPQGLRSGDGLASALNRAQAAAYYGGADLVGQAARLATGVSRAQAFVEGNKRTAFAVAAVFLDLNGSEFADDPISFAQLLDDLADPSVTDQDADDRFEAWLRDRVVPKTVN